MTSLELKILRACAGEIVSLPYNDEQRVATARLVSEGLIVSTYEDDCPTNVTTIKGELLLSTLLKERP